MSAQPCLRSLLITPLHARQPPITPHCCFPSQRLPQRREGESHPLVLHLPGPRLVSPTAALPKEPGDHGKDRVTTGNGGRQRPAMALGEAVAQHTWKGRESRGSHGKQVQTKQALTFAAVTTRVPRALPTFSSPPLIALGQFFVPQPPVLFLFQGCAHVYCDCTNSLQTRDFCYLPTAGTP